LKTSKGISLNSTIQIRNKPKVTKPSIPKPYTDVATGMEQQFLNHLIKQMRNTIPKEKKDSVSMEYYNSLLDSERARLMTEKNGGLGIQEMILKQILPHHLKQHLKTANLNKYKSNANSQIRMKEQPHE